MVDLHIHSVNSDGTFTPSEIIDIALKKELKAIALTDHDTVKGMGEIYNYGKYKGIELIAGTEISTTYLGVSVHVLGYYLNPFKKEFNDNMNNFLVSRTTRNEQIAARMNELGIKINYEEFLKEMGTRVVTRAHLAKYMVQKGYASTITDAFDKYLNPGMPCYVPRAKVTPSKAVEMILSGNGIAVLAHPLQYEFSEDVLENLIKEMIDAGMKGMEVYYSKYNPEQIKYLEGLADKYGLIKTGGSDCHGDNRPGCEIGTGYGAMNVPDIAVSNLKEEYLKNFKVSDKPGIMFFDMDGSLLSEKKVITPATLEALDECVKKGYVFSISTGRPLKSIVELSDRLGLTERYKPLISSYNGSVIYDTSKKEILSEVYHSSDTVKTVREIAYKNGVHIHSYSLNEILTERETEEVKEYCKYIKMDYKIIDDMLDNDKTFKLMIMDLNDNALLQRVRDEVMAAVGDKVECVFSTPILLEVLPKESGKGKALVTMSKLLGVDVDNTYAFADAENDISMLKAAGRGVCLINGYPKAMEAATHISFTDNDHDGLVPFLKELVK
jgi:Cof subfamily protein (haloacid dehalogenase superfamily)